MLEIIKETLGEFVTYLSKREGAEMRHRHSELVVTHALENLREIYPEVWKEYEDWVQETGATTKPGRHNNRKVGPHPEPDGC